MFRSVILALFLLAATTVRGQADLVIRVSSDLVSEMYNLMNSLNYQDTSCLNSIQKIVEKSIPVKAALPNVIQTGTVQQKEAARFFEVLLDYYPLIMGLRAGKEKEMYPLLLELEPRLYQYLDRSRFPLVFYYEKQKQEIEDDVAATIIADYYSYMAVCCRTLKKYKEGIQYARLAINFEYGYPWMKYASAVDLQICLRANGSPTSELLESFVHGIEICRRLSAEELADIKKYNYINMTDMADSAIKISTVVANADLRAKLILSAAQSLSKVDPARSTQFIKSLSGLKITSQFVLNALYRQADSLGLTTVKTQALATWQSLKTSEDQRFASLSATLDALMKASSDSGDPLSTITGEPTTSPYNSGAIKKSAVCLTGAIQCFITIYKNSGNGQKNIFWDAVVAEETAANLQGKNRALYQELCGLIGMLYREKPIEYSYGNENYFTLKPAKDTVLSISLYNNAGIGKDLVLLEAKFTR